MALSTEASLENAVISHLRAAITGLKSVAAYQGESAEEWLRKNVNAFPAAMVHIGRESAADQDEFGDLLFANLDVYVYVAARSPRSKTESREGAYDIMEDARTAMHNDRIGQGWFQWQEQDVALVTENISLYYQRYQARVQLS